LAKRDWHFETLKKRRRGAGGGKMASLMKASESEVGVFQLPKRGLQGDGRWVVSKGVSTQRGEPYDKPKKITLSIGAPPVGAHKPKGSQTKRALTGG